MRSECLLLLLLGRGFLCCGHIDYSSGTVFVKAFVVMITRVVP